MRDAASSGFLVGTWAVQNQHEPFPFSRTQKCSKILNESQPFFPILSHATAEAASSVQDVPVCAAYRDMVKSLRSECQPFLWTGKDNSQPCNPSNFRKHYRLAMAQMPGVRCLTPHCCRHTYVSQLQAMGAIGDHSEPCRTCPSGYDRALSPCAGHRQECRCRVDRGADPACLTAPLPRSKTAEKISFIASIMS